MMPAAYALKPSVTVILPRLPVASMSFIFSAFSNGLKIPALEYVNANDSRGLYQQPISYCSFKSLYRHCLRHFIDLWCQRSSQCPMCWQPISLKDPTSQELLEAVERERNFRINPPRNATIFHHPTLGDFELQHLPVGASDADLEERIIQHLAAAAAMGRARHIARREGQRNRSSAQGRPHFLVFSTHPNSPPMAPTSSSPSQRGDDEATPTIAVANLSPSPATGEQSSQLTLVAPVQAEQVSASGSGSSALGTEHQGSSYNNRRSPNQSSPSSQDRAGPSELQSFSESLKSKLNAVSSRYKESISKSTRGWKERWFSRNNAMSDIGSDVRREVNAGIATVSRMMERLETRDSNRSNINSAPSSSSS
ncbi:E3 ubiquitin-protein ligase RHF2A isoform X3 [Vigna angularis]|uniref:E3 ubiquitin-protein ligase RHF2A isoform X3 n=1 Tax=Phaseolus angularis TaxID=3914 RepID=UPI0022B5DF16|nr:E3 ubiquitin-protein ligase RHF2A isoform X3 [Vigna angularis]